MLDSFLQIIFNILVSILQAFPSLAHIILPLFAAFGLTPPAPPQPPDTIAPIVQISRTRLPNEIFDRDEALLRTGGVDITATDNRGVTGVTVELLRFPSATATAPNGFFNFTSRTFVAAPSAQTQTQALRTANAAIFRVNGASFPALTVGQHYGLRARARDAAGNTGTDLERFRRRAGFSATQTRITGRITNSNGTPVIGVLVRGIGNSSGNTRTATTDNNGVFELINITAPGTVVVAPDAAAGTFNPVSRTVGVTSANQGELGNNNFIRTGPPVTVSFRPGAYRIDFLLTGPPSAGGSLVIVVDANGVVAPTTIALPNGATGILQGTISASGQLALTVTDSDGQPDQLNATLASIGGVISGAGQIVDTDATGGPAVRGTFTATKLESGGPGANAFRPATYTVNFVIGPFTGRFHIFVNANGVATPTVIPFPDGTQRAIGGTVSSTGVANFTASDPNGAPDQINVNLTNQGGAVSGNGLIIDTDPGPLEPGTIGSVTVTKAA